MSIFDSIDQPTLLLDSSVAYANLIRMYEKVDRAWVRFRPHFKTHQSAEIGEWFRALGVNAITVSSVEMAEYFAAYDWQDILIAFPLNIRQLDRIRSLAQKIKLSVLVENSEAVRALARLSDVKLDVWLKIDTGNHRTGLDWTQTEKIAALCKEIDACEYLRLSGLLTHSGNTYHCASKEEIVQAFRQGVEELNHLRQALAARGFDSLEISVGDTPGCTLCEDFTGIDELRPGNFIFYDVQQLQIGVCKPEDIAVAVACPVVALHPERNEVVIYGGAIHLSKDIVSVDGSQSYGLVALLEGEGWGKPLEHAIVRSLSQEHGVLQFKHEVWPELKIGDLVFILPAHSCLTVQVLRKYLTLDGKTIQTLNQ
jgi:D-serine deaminase-like pyridoxal phosphate-dependent protein